MKQPIRLIALSWLTLTGISASAQSSIYLLGEVHDNPKTHSERLGFIQTLVTERFRPAIAMEQFDRESQVALNEAMTSCKSADCVIKKAGAKGWEWSYYKPIIEIAIRLRLPIIAANVSSKDTMKIVRDGFGSALSAETLHEFKLDMPLENEVFEKQKTAIDDGHCHMLPKSAFKGMVDAQVARDVWMAKMVRDNSSHGLILIAGNGHIRKDVGVYYWLSDEERARTQVIAFTEIDAGAVMAPKGTPYDKNFRVEPFDRGDPCEAFKRPIKIKT